MSAPSSSMRSRTSPAFTLVELLVVIAVIVLVLSFAVPAIEKLKNSSDVTASAYDLAGALEKARTFAIANNTYVWVGLFEEDASRAATTPATAGAGRVVISTVFSRDGTMIYDPSATTTTPLDPTVLGQQDKLLRIENCHLGNLADGDGSGNNLSGRPPIGNSGSVRISDSLPASPCIHPFSYPLTASSSNAQYTFTKIIQFGPNGEVKVNCAQRVQPLLEIGLIPSRGKTVQANSKNVVAVQMSGIVGNVRIYRP